VEELDRRHRTLDRVELLESQVLRIVQLARIETVPEDAIDLPSVSPYGPDVERFDGAGRFDFGLLALLRDAFAREFARPLPVRALGQTAVHRAMGFDHRNRVDVAVDPDHPEGVWLRQYLQREAIPYFAFRRPLPGRATAPHVHIGSPSASLRPAAAGR
jgi:hypothetical protein